MSLASLTASVVLKFLGAGVLVLARKDPRMQDELAAYPVGFALQIRAWEGGPVLCLAHTAEGWRATADRPLSPDVVEVVFKSRRSALLALLGLQSVTQAFLENRLIVRGDLMVTLPLVRAVNLVEAHLFPKFWTKAIGPLPPRQLSLPGTWVGAVGQLLSAPKEGNP